MSKHAPFLGYHIATSGKRFQVFSGPGRHYDDLERYWWEEVIGKGDNDYVSHIAGPFYDSLAAFNDARRELS